MIRPMSVEPLRPQHETTEAPVSASPDQTPEVSEDTIQELVQVFKLLADETRLYILFYLAARKELHVRALCDMLQQSQPAVSHHLALLRIAELIDSRRDGKHNFYRILPQRFQQLLDALMKSTRGADGQVRIEECLRTFSQAQ